MTYNDCLTELENLGLKDFFLNDFSDYITPEIEKHESIHSTASMLRVFIHNVNDKEIWEIWRDVLHYLMKPVFVRKEENLLDLQCRLQTRSALARLSTNYGATVSLNSGEENKTN